MLPGFAESSPNSSSTHAVVGMTRTQPAQDESLLLPTCRELDLFALYGTGHFRVLLIAGAEASTGTPPLPQAPLPWAEHCYG